jgi:N-acetylmuramoyl-L-alanine amidase
MLKVRRIFVRVTTVRVTTVRVTALLLSLLAIGLAAEPRRISVYAPQIGYQVDILLRDGVDYVGLTDLLEPLGHLESRVHGNKLMLNFNGQEVEFQNGKRQVRAGANPRFDLSANFLLVDGRGYIPAASIVQLLRGIAGQPADFHAAPRRLFIGSSQLRFAAGLRHAPSRLVLNFTAPVNPGIVIEKGRVHLFFRREPVVGNGVDTISYNDPFLLSTSFAELPTGAEFVADVGQPATVSVSDGGRTVTIAAVPPPAPPPPPPPVPLPKPSTAAPAATPPSAPRVRPFVILDAAHGGSETGAVLSPTLQEKTVNLSLARRLQKELEARGIPVVLTRVGDNVLTWDQRAISANTSHASLYVALHASAIGHGVRVYTSMLAPALPGQARRSVLPWELAQSPYLEQSSVAAAALAAACAADGLPVRTAAAPLRPLNNVTLAAVALEIAPPGSSPDELAIPEYQQKVAAALANAIAALRAKLEVQP